MARFPHPATRLNMGDPDLVPLRDAAGRPSEAELDAFAGNLILSASGWRTVFAADGDEESRTDSISPAGAVVATYAASVFAAYLKKVSGRDDPALILALDTRPTGPAIGATMLRAFLAEGCRVRYLFVSAAPEVMAYARSAGALEEGAAGKAHGFAFVSASHNPIGHNGLKFGLVDGGVLPGSEASLLIADFKALMAAPDRIERAGRIAAGASAQAVSRAFADSGKWKREAYSAYTLFTREVVTGSAELRAQDAVYDRIAAAVAERPLSIVADLNGSARTVTIDEDALTTLGIKLEKLNGQAGAIAHRIVPEGESLEPCRLRLEELHRQDPSFVLGYVPDCDGDRGNVVVWDDAIGGARSLEAQEVFALCCVAELAHLAWTKALRYDQKGNALDKVAVAVNDPTSMRVDRIAAAFDVEVFRAEVGEANVVGLARKLRGSGYAVRILGEGAAGGNITHPSAVRDPIDTVFALVKLLTIRSDADGPGLFELWCDLSGQSESYRQDFALADVIAALPSFTTTSAYEEEAILRIKSTDHGALKDRYQEIFLADWEAKKDDLTARMGLVGWEAIAYNGTEERRGIPRFGEAGKGGLKILFSDAAGHPKAYVWMRGSGTEPVFRVMADVAGPDRRIERELLEWQRSMVQRADLVNAAIKL
jgi:phosphoglucomutase